MILTIRTDKPEPEIGLFDKQDKRAYEVWQAHRRLAETIHLKIEELLKSQEKRLGDITGIVVYQGPGSFTGLRIGISVANALAYSLLVPIATATGDDWVQTGINNLLANPQTQPVMPEYGSPANITQPRK